MLLYKRGTDWQDAPVSACSVRIRMALPLELRHGWTLIERGLTRGARELEAANTAAWIAAHGAALGFRTPSIAERARAMGMAPYLASLRQLGLDDYQVFNAQRNSFDRAVIALRIRGAIEAWARGDQLPRHTFPAPEVVLQSYNRLRESVVRQGLPACPSPFPRDLQSALLHGFGATAPRQNSAAENGRAAG